MTLNRFAHITNNRDEGMRFAENARYQSRLASSLRHEVMQGTVMVDVSFPTSRRWRPSTTTCRSATSRRSQRSSSPISARRIPCTCAFRARSAAPQKAAMRSMELMMDEVKPRVTNQRGMVFFSTDAKDNHHMLALMSGKEGAAMPTPYQVAGQNGIPISHRALL